MVVVVVIKMVMKMVVVVVITMVMKMVMVALVMTTANTEVKTTRHQTTNLFPNLGGVSE